MAGQDDGSLWQRRGGSRDFCVARIVAGDDQLDIRPPADHLGEGLNEHEDVLVRLPLTEVEEKGRPDSEVTLPGGFGRRVAHR
jgi:hypothetical protein